MDDIQLVATMAAQLLAFERIVLDAPTVRERSIADAVSIARAIVAETQRQFRDALPVDAS